MFSLNQLAQVLFIDGNDAQWSSHLLIVAEQKHSTDLPFIQVRTHAFSIKDEKKNKYQTRVDVKKFPKYATGQACGSCALFQGKATDKAGAYPLFAGKQVAGAGWYSAYVKKA